MLAPTSMAGEPFIKWKSPSRSTRVSSATIKGSTKLKISRGTQSAEIFKLKGEGVPNVRGYGRGDLIIQVIVKIPKKLTRKQEELLREFAVAGGNGVEEEFNPLKKVKDYMKKNIKI